MLGLLRFKISQAKSVMKNLFSMHKVAKRTSRFLQRDIVIASKSHKKFFRAAAASQRARNAVYKGLILSKRASRKMFRSAHSATKLMNTAVYEQMKLSTKANARSKTERKLLVGLLRSLRTQVSLIHKMVKAEKAQTHALIKKSRDTARSVH